MARSMAEPSEFRTGVTACPPSRQQAMPSAFPQPPEWWALAHAPGRIQSPELRPFSRHWLGKPHVLDRLGLKLCAVLSLGEMMMVLKLTRTRARKCQDVEVPSGSSSRTSIGNDTGYPD
ncbi:hypothetical protein IG631_07368 [Alternaria alternata]|nr:hypothetical protein IG631_07368 [Alternaria alternata]